MKYSNTPYYLLILISILVVCGMFFFFWKGVSVPGQEQFVVVCLDEDVSCHPTNLPYQDASLSTQERVTDLLGRMTLAEKIGQMALVEKNSIKNTNDIAKYGLGALLSGGGGNPVDNTPMGWKEMIQSFQTSSEKTRLRIPILYGVDANHGHSNVPGATIFPHAIGLGAAENQELTKNIARATAKEVAATGVNWIFSPNLDVGSDARWGRTYETFGSNTENIAELGQAFVEGVNTVPTVLAGAKHFVGNGASEWGTSINKNFFIDQGNTSLSEEALRNMHLTPFVVAIDAGVGSIMVGLNQWNNEKVVFNKYLVQDVLKDELGFDGFVFSDWYGVYEGESNKSTALIRAINAGVDMVMLPYDYEPFSRVMHRAVAEGDISHARIDDAVARILTVKFDTGLFDTEPTNVSDIDIVGSKEHKALARVAVQQSLVLLKNNDMLPLSKKLDSILVAGSSADNIGRQSGGWTVEWAGFDGNWIPGTTILEGIKNTVSPATRIQYGLQGVFEEQTAKADVGIAIVGEMPYAEGWGDREHPALSLEDLNTITRLKAQSKKVIVVIVSGRPLDIAPYIDDWDAVVAAWLPGSEGMGVADVLFGDVPFTGKLPIEWEL
jgi:beta-glucosidase